MNAALARLRLEMFAAGQILKGEDLEEFNALVDDLAECFDPTRLMERERLARAERDDLRDERDAARKALAMAEEHNALLVKERDVLRADCLRRITEVADAAQAEVLLARSSLGSVPMADHAKLINAIATLVGSVNEVLDVAGHYLTTAMRRDLDRALDGVDKAVG